MNDLLSLPLSPSLPPFLSDLDVDPKQQLFLLLFRGIQFAFPVWNLADIVSGNMDQHSCVVYLHVHTHTHTHTHIHTHTNTHTHANTHTNTHMHTHTHTQTHTHTHMHTHTHTHTHTCRLVSWVKAKGRLRGLLFSLVFASSVAMTQQRQGQYNSFFSLSWPL